MTHLSCRSALFALAMIASAAHVAAQTDAGVRAVTDVVLVGDSITAGVGPSSGATTYGADLGRLLGSGVSVSGFGYPGATMLSSMRPSGFVAYTSLQQYTDATHYVMNVAPDAVVDVIIMLGTNDANTNNWLPSGAGGPTNATEFAADYAAMVQHFANLPSHPVVYLAFPPTSYIPDWSDSVIANEIIPIIQQVAHDAGMPTIDVHTPTSGHPEYYADMLHPNDTGSMVIAMAMYEALTGETIPPRADAGPVPDARTVADAATMASMNSGMPGGHLSGGCSVGHATKGVPVILCLLLLTCARSVRRRR